MNYIKHLTGFFEKVKNDPEINPSAISIYMAIFQIWNQNRFKSPIHATRDELMYTSKIGSTATYHKCIKLLEQKEYIIYTPSFSSYTRTSIIILPLENYTKSTSKRVQKISPTYLINEKDIEQVSKQPNDQPTKQGLEQPLAPLYSIYNNKHIKTVNKQIKTSNNQLFVTTSTKKNGNEILSSSKINEKNDKPGAENSYQKKAIKNSQKVKEEKNEIPPVWDRVFEFFISKSSTRQEAEKFYNYFQSNGWLVGGKAKMKDWHAAARNWIANSQNFKSKNNQPQPNHLNSNQDKNYAEPL